MAKLAKTVRNATLVDVVLAFARDRLVARLPGVKPRRRRPSARALALGGGGAAALAALVLKRRTVAALLPGRSPAPDPVPSPPGFKPVPTAGPSNYDVSGPATNTATPVPVPEAYAPPAIDEAAEEAAAAAEAANIGGTVSDYAAPSLGEDVAPEEIPLAEAGGGASEGQEQTEAELALAAEPTAPGESDEERQIDDAIDAASNPALGETPEPRS